MCPRSAASPTLFAPRKGTELEKQEEGPHSALLRLLSNPSRPPRGPTKMSQGMAAGFDTASPSGGGPLPKGRDHRQLCTDLSSVPAVTGHGSQYPRSPSWGGGLGGPARTLVLFIFRPLRPHWACLHDGSVPRRYETGQGYRRIRRLLTQSKCVLYLCLFCIMPT